MSSHTISAVQDAPSSTWLTVPKRVLSWWWGRSRRRLPVLEQLLDAKRLVDGVVEDEAQLGRVLEVQLGGDAALQVAVGRAQPLERRLLLGRRAEDAHVHASMAEVGRG